MILAVVLRNYKCYKGINFIPLRQNIHQNMNMIIGDNGVGKSSVLESMDTFFNDAPWILNTDSSDVKEASIGILFLLKKDQLGSCFTQNEKLQLDIISHFFWDLDLQNVPKQYKKLVEIKKCLCEDKDEYYLIMIGKNYNKELGFLSFESAIKNKILEVLQSSGSSYSPSIRKVLEKVVSLHTYLYIPVETSISEFLKLETAGMQTLMDKSIKETITKALSSRRIIGNSGRARKQTSLLTIINEELEEFITNVEKDIQTIDDSYNYQLNKNQTKKLTAYHITDAIVKAYYTKRTLKKGKSSIQTLSSGEKRVALTDLILAFIRKREITDNHLVIAIDEPENSLHISNCYKQFHKLEDISGRCQLFVTTHWYGSLPILDKGSLIHINKGQENLLFDLGNYFEDRRTHPDDIYLKGFFDLTSSILSAFRDDERNWLLVEGKEDKKYIEYYLNPKERSKINILPLGGCGNVKKVYEYLFTPMSSKQIEFVSTKKIMCIVDTDELCTEIAVNSITRNGQLLIKRLHENEQHEIEFKRIEDPNKKATEIEDILEPLNFYNSLRTAIAQFGDNNIKDCIDAFGFDDKVKNSRIKGDYSILNHQGNGRNVREDKELISKFIDDYKENIAEIYTSNPNTNERPNWINLILKDLGIVTEEG
jgi:hypothetical protein